MPNFSPPSSYSMTFYEGEKATLRQMLVSYDELYRERFDEALERKIESRLREKEEIIRSKDTAIAQLHERVAKAEKCAEDTTKALKGMDAKYHQIKKELDQAKNELVDKHFVLQHIAHQREMLEKSAVRHFERAERLASEAEKVKKVKKRALDVEKRAHQAEGRARDAEARLTEAEAAAAQTVAAEERASNAERRANQAEARVRGAAAQVVAAEERIRAAEDKAARAERNAQEAEQVGLLAEQRINEAERMRDAEQARFFQLLEYYQPLVERLSRPRQPLENRHNSRSHRSSHPRHK
jgi:Uncharacterized protein conserved in bacteria with the myosin-like domain